MPTRFYRKITGERLYLSPFDPENVDSHTKWAEWHNDREVANYFGGFHNLVTVSSAKKTLPELIGHRFDIVLQDGDELIGHISLHNIDHHHRNAFFGIMIGSAKHRNKGYGTEALRLLLEYGFKSLNLHNIMLSVVSDDHGAIACYKKLGFKDAGTRREWQFKNGKYVDVLYMDMLEHEFEV